MSKNEKDDGELTKRSTLDTREAIPTETQEDEWVSDVSEECAKCFCRSCCEACKKEFGLEIFCCLDCLMEGQACELLIKFMRNKPKFKNDVCIICNKKANKNLRYYDGKPYCNSCLQDLKGELNYLENLRFLSLEKEFELLQDFSFDTEIMDFFQYTDEKGYDPSFSNFQFPISSPLAPWKEDGQRWHLVFRTQGKRTEAVIATVDLLVEVFGREPSWEQSQYIAFTYNSRTQIARLETYRKSYLCLEIRLKKNSVRPGDIRSQFRKLPKFTIERRSKNFDAIRFIFSSKDEIITPQFHKFMKYICNNELRFIDR